MTETLVEYLQEEFKRMDTDHAERTRGWEKLYRQFRGIIDKSAEGKNKKSSLFINKTKVAVIGGVANLVDILFPGTDTDFFDVIGRTDTDQKSSSIVKQVTQWLTGLGNFHSEAVRYILQAAVYGTAFGKVTSKAVTEVSVDKFPILNFVLKPLGFKNLRRSEKFEYPKFEHIDIFDIWVDPAAYPTLQDGTGLFHRVRRTLGYLRAREREGIYHNIDKIADKIKESTKHSEDKRRNIVGLSDFEYYPEEIELYEYWGIVPAALAKQEGITTSEGEYEIECVITVAGKDKDIIIRAERNTYPNQERMFISDVWEPTAEKSIYGRGVCENVHGSQMALNATVNIRIDNKAWAIAAPLIVNHDNLVDPSADLVPRPNWIVRGRGKPSDIAEFVSVPDVSSGSTTEAQEFERYIEEESGISKTLMGPQSFGSNRTLGGISIAFSAASRPLRLIAREFERNLISKSLKKLYMMFFLKINKSFIARLTDDPAAPSYIEVDPGKLSMDIDFIPSGTLALASREAVVQNLTQFVQAISGLPNVAQSLNWEYLIRKFYEGLGFRDFDKVWSPTPMMGGQFGTPGNAPVEPGTAGTPGGVATPEGEAGAPAGMGGLEEILRAAAEERRF